MKSGTDAFEVQGGKKLKGEIIPQGAKNEALEILCAVLLTEEKVTVHNIPDILDVNNLISLLGEMGVLINKIGEGSYEFTAKEVN
ncbi:MAG: UDP-N-acetylglucosamine 1-carboxyvinyltransferase, partial [Flammeovirgaceae bacterium]|nr:UDP-N-acetylglucosamine 1-carboxyvinyltransferase [Flammeovirgaceae bacterium]MDW8288488.1 UDP-N-acetylglucosamine 1-carboxyvinyltransferase [Flammeovirgaceae bacterium]